MTSFLESAPGPRSTFAVAAGSEPSSPSSCHLRGRLHHVLLEPGGIGADRGCGMGCSQGRAHATVSREYLFTFVYLYLCTCCDFLLQIVSISEKSVFIDKQERLLLKFSYIKCHLWNNNVLCLCMYIKSHSIIFGCALNKLDEIKLSRVYDKVCSKAHYIIYMFEILSYKTTTEMSGKELSGKGEIFKQKRIQGQNAGTQSLILFP